MTVASDPLLRKLRMSPVVRVVFRAADTIRVSMALVPTAIDPMEVVPLKMLSVEPVSVPAVSTMALHTSTFDRPVDPSSLTGGDHWVRRVFTAMFMSICPRLTD